MAWDNFQTQLRELYDIHPSIAKTVAPYVISWDFEEAGKLCEEIGAYKQAYKFYSNGDRTLEHSPIRMAIRAGMFEEAKEETEETLNNLGEAGYIYSSVDDIKEMAKKMRKHFDNADDAIEFCDIKAFGAVAGAIALEEGRTRQAYIIFRKEVDYWKAVMKDDSAFPDWIYPIYAGVSARLSGSYKEAIRFYVEGAIQRKEHPHYKRDQQTLVDEFVNYAIDTAKEGNLQRALPLLERIKKASPLTSRHLLREIM